MIKINNKNGLTIQINKSKIVYKDYELMINDLSFIGVNCITNNKNGYTILLNEDEININLHNFEVYNNITVDNIIIDLNKCDIIFYRSDIEILKLNL